MKDSSNNDHRVLTTSDEGSGNGLDADTVDGTHASSFALKSGATFTGNITLDNNADLVVGDGSGDERIFIKKADNNVSDHLQFFNGTTRMGEIGCQDTSFLRLNQVTNKPIYTPRYIRADSGFFVDGTSKGINGSGNFIGGTIAGASDYGTLLRSDANDTFTGTLTAGQNGKIAFPDKTTIPDDPTNQQHDYITFGAHGSISQISGRGALMIASSDDSMVFANGDVGRTFTNSNINVDPEEFYFLSDGGFQVITGLQNGFGSGNTLLFNSNGALSINGNSVLTTANEGSGNGIDADTCDGQHLGTSANVQFANLTATGTVNFDISQLTAI